MWKNYLSYALRLVKQRRESEACIEYRKAVEPLVISSAEVFEGENYSDDCPVSLE
jgi:hypothetical protein